jgi:Mn2+/Fe2+ NRAMP family transporter
MAFLGAVAYSGAAGNLVLSHSFYVQDEGMGMAGNMNTQIDRNHRVKGLPIGLEGEDTEENLNNFRKWFRLAAIEQSISFWLVGIITIILLTIISFSLVYPFDGEEGLSFVTMQSDLLSSRFGSIIGTFFIVIGITFLFTTQLGIFETTSRIMTENLQLMSEKIKNRFERDSIFFAFLWMQVIAAIIITMFGLEQPIQLLLLGTFFSALSMFVLSGLILWLNTSKLLKREIRPGYFRRLILLVSTLFFGIFVAYTVYDLFLV